MKSTQEENEDLKNGIILEWITKGTMDLKIIPIFIWDFNCQVGSSLADWFYSMPNEQRKNIKKAIFATEGMLDCNPGFPEALRRYKINQAIEAILK